MVVVIGNIYFFFYGNFSMVLGRVCLWVLRTPLLFAWTLFGQRFVYGSTNFRGDQARFTGTCLSNGSQWAEFWSIQLPCYMNLSGCGPPRELTSSGNRYPARKPDKLNVITKVRFSKLEHINKNHIYPSNDRLFQWKYIVFFMFWDGLKLYNTIRPKTMPFHPLTLEAR